ncbi:Aromatic-amino-acid aminotransferase [Vibrio aerogenes CECT 7868]|uniref:Aromatic-amino-acid aminotransferase n=1 Tax=Vibrio aerogenes CECT 7868 TaxID=1216006 RepID=A0A1M5ZUA4_9VIBR|nr:amino acid aminotransferase [Vibrio aerogenes]SHI27792.1 Aromatic-amino-acid aminotransferase [Vibrio aerogenes CECT 7868]
MFSHLPDPVLDPILSLSSAFREDNRPDKVDLGIGVYRNNQGQTPIMRAIRSAESRLMETQTTKSYVGLAGDEVFNQCIARLVLGEATPVSDRLVAVQTPGASGALRMLGDLIHTAQPGSTVWLSDPSYVNHRPVMEAAGLKVKQYQYFCRETKRVDIPRMLDDLSKAGSEDIVLLHGCCHNPTGADIDFAAWQAVTELAQKNGFTPFVDLAYQGFGDGLEEDVKGLRWMAERVEEMMITSSCSKNFGLYRERTGAAIVIGKNASDATNAKGKILTLARATYTMPPDHGAALVRTVLQDPDLKQSWHQELAEMQQRLLNLRQMLCKTLRDEQGTQAFDFIESHKGMFTVIGFSALQMGQLRNDYGIYGVNDGRINIAGLSESDISYVAKAIAQVANQKI